MPTKSFMKSQPIPYRPHLKFINIFTLLTDQIPMVTVSISGHYERWFKDSIVAPQRRVWGKSWAAKHSEEEKTGRFKAEPKVNQLRMSSFKS